MTPTAASAGDGGAIRVLAMLDSYKVDGIAKAVLEFARQARRTDLGAPRVEVTILTYTRGGVETDFVRAVRMEGIPLAVVDERRRFDRGIIPHIKAVAGSRAYDVLWTSGMKSHFLARVAGLDRNAAWVAFHHGYTTTDWTTRLYNQLDRWSLRAPDRVMTVCRAFGADLRRRSGVTPDRLRIQHMPIHPGAPVPEQETAALRRALGLNPGTRVLLAVGRLSKEKGHADLIRAVALMHEARPSMDLRLLIGGDGPERKRLDALTSHLNLTSAVAFLGYQNDVRPYYALAEVFVLPSHSEGSPNVLLEAMARGLPVVATAVGGVPEIAANERDALLVDRHDVPALTRAVLRVLDDGDLRQRLGSAARDVLNRHSPEDYFRSIRLVFQEVIKR